MAEHPKLGILAGGGVAPSQIVKACRATARPCFVFCLEGHADPSLLPEGTAFESVSLGAMQRFKELCAREQIKEIVMIGPVRRPSIAEIKPDWLALKILAKVGLNSLGDDGLLRNLGKALEDECGVRVIGASQIMAGLLTPPGLLGQTAPTPEDRQDIQKAVQVAQLLGQADVGQAVIVQQGIVLALEAIEGTAAMISRAGALRREGSGGVLVKWIKPQQDRRFDLPSIGPDTIRQLHEAGLRGVALCAGGSQIIDREETLRLANAFGLFVIGVDEHGVV